MFDWLNKIVEWFGQLFPRWVIVDITTGAIKLKRGYNVVKLEPGIHWYWPAMTKYDEYPAKRTSDALPSQTLMTADRVTFTVNGLLVSEVVDIVKLLTECHSPVRMIQDITTAAIHDVCCKLTWDELCEMNQKTTLDTKLKNEAQKQLADYGVKVIKCQLIDLTNKTRVLRVINSHVKEVD